MGRSQTMSFVLRKENQLDVKPLLKILATSSLVEMNLMHTSVLITFTQCFVYAWNIGLEAKAKTLMLSHQIIGKECKKI